MFCLQRILYYLCASCQCGCRMFYKSLTAVIGNFFILRIFQSVLLKVHKKATLNLHHNEHEDLGSTQTYIVLPALDLKDPLQSLEGLIKL